jgi:alpha-L-arabinofuranosidase
MAGNNFVASYYWEDGIGPKDQRQQDLTWHGTRSKESDGN